MTGRKSFAASAGISTPVAAIVIVIIVCGSAFGIVELQLSSTDSGRSTVTATVTTTLISTITIVSSTHLTQSALAQVAVTATSLRSSDFLTTNAGMTFTCGAAAGSYLTLSNVGTAGTDISGVTIDWAGQADSYSPAAGSSCFVGAAGSASATLNLLFATTTNLHFTATAGGAFSGTVSLGSGAIILFAGTFMTTQSLAEVAVTATALKAVDFLATGTSSGFTCGAAAGSYLTLTNSGTAPAIVTSMTLVVAGVSNTFALTSGICTVAAVGAAANNPQNLLFVADLSHTTVNAVAGNAFSGTVTLNNGAVLIFAGTFQ